MLAGIKGLCHTCPILFLINSNFVSWKGRGGRRGEGKEGEGRGWKEMEGKGERLVDCSRKIQETWMKIWYGGTCLSSQTRKVETAELEIQGNSS